VVENADPVLAANDSRRHRPWPISAYVAGFVAVFVLASGSGLVGLAVTRKLSSNVLAITLSGLLVFVLGGLVFYRRIAKTEADIEVSAMLAAIIESSADAIIAGTLDGVITTWNTGAEQQYGYAADEIIGRSASELMPPDRTAELAYFLESVRRGEIVADYETKRRRKDGAIIDVSVSVSPLRDASGAIAGVSTVARNITERVRFEADRRALERQQQHAERLQSLGQLAAGIAHDFNNLLAVILSYAGFVAEATEDRPAVRADIDQIMDAAQRAARITRQLLIVGRRDSHRPEPLTLNDIVTDTCDLLSSTIGTDVEIRRSLARDLPNIEADRGQIEQVLLNLAINARDAMPDGGVLTIRTSVADLGEDQAGRHPSAWPGRYVELDVSDTGTGMSAEVTARLFEPFFTTKPQGAGTGLGLATVYAIIINAGGSISVHSEEGTGTTFRALIPVTVAPVRPTPQEPEAAGHGETILVVEDEPPVMKLTSRILRQNGYTTLEAATFDEALSLVSAQNPQLLLTDSVMPHMSGAQLAERIHELRPGLPVLYMSGYSAAALTAHHTLDEKTQFIQKPFTPQILLNKVHAALGTSASDQPAER
jgi:PAS domain S-box-containing protein